MDAQPTAHDQPDDDGTFAAIVARLDFDADDPTTTPTSPGHQPESAEPAKSAPDSSAAGEGDTKSGTKVRAALADWISARAATLRTRPPKARKTRKDEDDEPITTGAFATVMALTVAVAALAFALSFDMMRTAAMRYGWSPEMAALFPVLVDVGTVGGVLMGAISTHRIYRTTGHQLVVATLAASVLFNLVGHDIRGGAAAGLPAHWSWSGTCAAVLVPVLLALFVHAAGRAVRTWTEQRRIAKQNEIDERNRRQRAERERRQTVSVAPQPAPQPETEKEPAPAPKPAAKPRKKSTGKSGRSFDQETARRELGDEFDRLGPSEINKRMAARGYDTVNPSTIRRWRR